MRESRILPWRPRSAKGLPASRIENLWTMAKQDFEVRCAIEPGGCLGWMVRVQMNGQWGFRCEFTTRSAALEAAEIKFFELSYAGWTPATS